MITVKNRISLILLLVLLLVRVSMILLEHTYQIILIGTHNVPLYIDTLLIILLFLSFRIKTKSVKVLLYLFVILIFMVEVVMNNFWGIEVNEYSFSSPDKTSTLIIDESSFLLSSNINAYQKKYLIFKKTLPNVYISTDDGYTPFEKGEFNLDWIDNKIVSITYYANFNADTKWKSVTVLLD